MLIFSTPTSADIDDLLTFGLSAKEPPAGTSPFGQFGTGLKYAIAGVLRLGGNITIEIDESAYVFQTQLRESRGKEFFQISYKTGRYARTFDPILTPTSFTTALGSHWTPEMLYRELWANTQDEGGVILDPETDSNPAPQGSGTRICISCPEIEAIHADPSGILLSRTEPAIYSSPTLEVFPSYSSKIFANGIAVCNADSCTYNIISRALPLTEDRTVAEQWCTNTILTELLTAEGPEMEKVFEHIFLEARGNECYWFPGFALDCEPSEQFLSFVIEHKRELPSYILDFAEAYIPDIKAYTELQLTPDEQAQFLTLYSSLYSNIITHQPEADDKLSSISEIKFTNFSSTYIRFITKNNILWIAKGLLAQDDFAEQLLEYLINYYANPRKAFAELFLPPALRVHTPV